MRKANREQYQKDIAVFRYSSDTSVQVAIKESMSELKLNIEEQRVLDWNIRHAEYSFGANVDDLSMVSDRLSHTGVSFFYQ